MIRLIVNGHPREIAGDPETRLVNVLRDTLGLGGTRYGCGQGRCGACTVIIGGKAVRSCGVPLLGVNGTVIISHGASGPKAVMNAIRVARRGAQNGITDRVSESLARYDSYYRKLKPHRFWDSFIRKTV